MTETAEAAEPELVEGLFLQVRPLPEPAHDGHRYISALALKLLRLDQVWWLVSPQNPLKSATDMAPLDRRLARARQVAGHPRIVPTALERDLGTRYTAQTLDAISARFPGTRFVWLMGADNLLQLPHWRRWQRIFYTMPVAIFARPSYSLRALGGQAATRFEHDRRVERDAGSLADQRLPAWIFFHTRLLPVSATELRERQERA